MIKLARRAYAKLIHILTCAMVQRLAGDRVMAGPFAGMTYIKSNLVSYCPKALGTYELELAEIIDRLCTKEFEVMVNVGAAEGYYAVGFALRNPQTQVIAFEADDRVRHLLIRMAKLNGVADRLKVYGRCDRRELSESLSGSGQSLVIMDVEGEEAELLDPERVPGLRNVHILVELHDFVSQNLAPTILERFQADHKVTEIWSRSRQIGDFPALTSSTGGIIKSTYLMRASMNEGRPGTMRWFFLEPQVGPRPAGRSDHVARLNLSG